jgi:hypothetical protein
MCSSRKSRLQPSASAASSGLSASLGTAWRLGSWAPLRLERRLCPRCPACCKCPLTVPSLPGGWSGAWPARRRALIPLSRDCPRRHHAAPAFTLRRGARSAVRRPLRALDARGRGRGCCPARRLPGAVGHGGPPRPAANLTADASSRRVPGGPLRRAVAVVGYRRAGGSASGVGCSASRPSGQTSNRRPQRFPCASRHSHSDRTSSRSPRPSLRAS